VPAKEGEQRGTLRVERITRRDTVIVRTLGGSVWGQVARKHGRFA